MKAITTKFSGPTGGRGARITATDGDYRVVVPYEYNNAEAEHRAAAVKLCKTKWRTDGDTCDKLIGGDRHERRGGDEGEQEPRRGDAGARPRDDATATGRGVRTCARRG
jgi:hypothetical protein